MEKRSIANNWKRNTFLFIAGQMITLFGSSIVQMALIWEDALQTSSGLWVTVLTLSATIPQTVMSVFAGAIADRYSKKKLIVLADAGIAAVTLALAGFLLSGSAVQMLPLVIIISAIRSFGAGLQTPAVSAVIPQIVPEQHRMRYNGINSSMMSIVQFAAPAVAGAILNSGPFHWILLIDVVTAIVGIAILGFVKIPVVKTEMARNTFFADLKQGIGYAATEKHVGKLLLIFGVFIFLSVPSGFLTTLMIERTFGGEYLYLTVSEMLGFAGMVLGGVLLGVWGGFKNQQATLWLGLLAYGLFSVLLGFAHTFWFFAVLIFFVSFAIPIVQSSVTTMLQASVPETHQGRVFGLFGAIYSGFMPLGMALFGPLADVVPIQSMVVACGGLLVLFGFVYTATTKRRIG